MGAAILPLVISAVGSMVQQAFAPPPPAPVIIKPGAVSPDLSQSAASQIAKTTEQKGQEFGNQMMNTILDHARKQGLSEKDLSNVSNQFNQWFNSNQGQINETMKILAAHSQDQANYVNQVNQNNFDTQYQALQASQPKSGGFMGALIPGILNAGLGGMMGGGIVQPTITDTSGGGGTLFSGGDPYASA